MTLHARPASCHEHCDSKITTGNVLLVAEVLIGGHKDLVTGQFGLSQKLTVLQSAPSELEDGCNDVVGQTCSKRNRRALIEQDAHLCDLQGASRLFEYGASLFQSYARKPLNKFGNLSTIFKVLEQCCDRDASATKYPRTANAGRISFHSGTGTPIDHGVMLRRPPGGGKPPHQPRGTAGGSALTAAANKPATSCSSVAQKFRSRTKPSDTA